MEFTSKCVKCGKIYAGNEYIVACKNGCDSLIRAEYANKKLALEDLPGIWKYINWLPVKNFNENFYKRHSFFDIYQSQGLAKYLGLKNLFVCTNVYSSEGNKLMPTGSFKDIEAEAALQRIIDSSDSGKPCLISSDGNIALSFIYASNLLKYPVVVAVTEEGRKKRIWSYFKNNPYLLLISITDNSDYFDAIRLIERLGENKNLLLEGGSRNIARRDAVGTIMLEATILNGRMPDHYFQALGSGPGAIGVYEASIRLIEDGRYGNKLPKIHAAQNYPFIPMAEAWQNASRKINPIYQNEKAKDLIKQVYAAVLTNRFPSYSIAGGVYDVLNETSGHFYSITNEEAFESEKLFLKLEGKDIVAPSAITVASLVKAVKLGTVNKDELILLNITGGGREKIKDKMYKVKPEISIGQKYNFREVEAFVSKTMFKKQTL